jgi:hypothetical protein
MDKGIDKKLKKLEKEIEKKTKKFDKNIEYIEKSNIKSINTAITSLIKNTPLSQMSHRATKTVNVYIHKETFNFPSSKQQLLNYIKDISSEKPYVTITTTDATNILKLSINWEDFKRTNSSSRNTASISNLPNLGLEKKFETIKIQNMQRIQNSLNGILADVNKYETKISTKHRIFLANETMFHEITRNDFKEFSQKIVDRYGGVVEIETIASNAIIITIHWSIYLAQLANNKQSQKQVPLISTPDAYDEFVKEEPQTKIVKIRKRKHSYPSVPDTPLYPPVYEEKQMLDTI